MKAPVGASIYAQSADLIACALWCISAQSHFVIHDADKSGTLDLYQMVLALQDGACGLWLAVLWDSCQTNHLPSLTPRIMSLCSWLYVLLWNV